MTLPDRRANPQSRTRCRWTYRARVEKERDAKPVGNLESVTLKFAELVALTREHEWVNRHLFRNLYPDRKPASADRLWCRTLRRLLEVGVPHRIRMLEGPGGKKMKGLALDVAVGDVEAWARRTIQTRRKK